VKKLNNIKIVVVLTTLGLLLSSCSSSEETASSSNSAGAKLCVIHNNADHPSITALTNGVNDEAKVSGMDVSFFDPAMDPQKQVSMIEDCIAAQSNVIAVNAVDPLAVIPAIKKAKEAGIKVCMITGDKRETAINIARSCGLISTKKSLVNPASILQKYMAKVIHC
jgi:ABC-type sugar transport system substrate-binding protein